MANQYKNFQKGFSLVPKAATLDGPYNAVKGDFELLSSTNKLYFHNGTINDAIVQENVQATLSLKTLTAPVINNSTADTITGIAGGALLLQSASNQNLSLQAQGTGKVLLESITVDASNISASTDIVINQTGGSKTYFQVTGTNVARVDADGIAFLTQDAAKFYDADSSNYVGIKSSSTVPSDYTITLPSAAPTANTALVYDGTAYKWGAAGGADSAGANDDILATAFRARIIDSFDDAPSLVSTGSSTINGNATVTTATHVPANQLYQIQYINTSISGANTLTPTITPVGGYTLQQGDAVVFNGQVRFLNASLGINTAFTGALTSGPCVVSKTVSSWELYTSNFDGDSISDAFSSAPFSEYLIDYQDSTTAIYQVNVTPTISYSVSQDASTWSDPVIRPQNQNEQISSGSFASPGTGLYVRLFANANTAGSGTVNLLEYRAYMQKSPNITSGTLNQAYGKLNTLTAQQYCTISVSGGKTRATLTWTYSTGVNPGFAYGALDVYVNGQILPRYVDATTTSAAYYKEISNTIIELDTDYSATPYAIQVIQRQPNANFTTSSGSSGSSVGSGLKNYLTTYKGNSGNGDFETGNTTGWSLFNTTLTSLIPTGSIGSGAGSITTFQATATNPLAATYSLSVGSSGVLTAGQGIISNAFTIDLEDQTKVLTFSFAYQAVSGTMNFSGTSSNTWAVYLYDGVNWIQPAGVYNLIQSSGVGLATGTFQTTSTATSYRIAVICVNSTGGAVSMKFDDFFVGPQISVTAPAVSDWVSYTPTFTSFTTSSQTFWWKRVGDTLQVKGRFTVASVSGTEAQVSIPFTSADSTKINGTLEVAGKAEYSNVSTTFFGGLSVLIEPSKAYITFGVESSTVAPLTKVTGSQLSSVGQTISLFAQIPIAGWSSNTVSSADTDTRVVAASVNTLSSTSITANTALQFTTTVIDTHGAITTGTGYKFTAPVSGNYRISASMAALTASNGSLYAAKNGIFTFSQQNFITSSSSTQGGGGSIILPLNAGDTVQLAFNTSVTAASNNFNFNIDRLSGPAIVQASETVAASYYINAASSPFAASTTVPINFSTMEFDTHNAVTVSATAWKFTAPISGIYEVSTYAYGDNPGTSVSFYIYKNQPSVGTPTKVINFQKSGQNSSGSCLIKLNAGDFIDMRPNQPRNITGAALNAENCSIIEIKRIGY